MRRVIATTHREFLHHQTGFVCWSPPSIDLCELSNKTARSLFHRVRSEKTDLGVSIDSTKNVSVSAVVSGHFKVSNVSQNSVVVCDHETDCYDQSLAREGILMIKFLTERLSVGNERSRVLQTRVLQISSGHLRLTTSAVAVVLLGAICVFTINLKTVQAASTDRPNIVLIYADDLGYGDISCNGATEVSTPNVDRIAKEGLNFTDGHCASATCTPSRYAMLTGEYAWRKAGTGIAKGDAAAIIRPERTTLASILKKGGYHTGVVGKWHLGLGDGNVNWNAEIKPGPREIGFDESFLIPATGDRVPCVYVEDRHVVGLDPADPIKVSFSEQVGDEPTGRANAALLKMHPSHGHDFTIVNGISRIGYMSGGHAARWVDEEMADVITTRAIKFVEDNKAKPFFLFFSYHDIHVPRVPHPRFVGKTTMGPRGDAIIQLDWCTGEILKALDQHGLAENTLVIFSSDNGPVIDDGYQDEAVEKLGNHKPAGPFRGGKYSAYEGGTRVPFLVRWPAKVKAGTTSEALICQIDFPASFAHFVGYELKEEDAPDSFNMWSPLIGESTTGRDHLIEHAKALSYRKGNWKIIEKTKGPKILENTKTESGFYDNIPLFDLNTDLGEKMNIAAQHPKKVAELMQELNQIRDAGRSR